MDLTLSSNIDRAFRKYVSTNMLSMLGSCIYVLVDLIFVARGIGSAGLTALSLVLPFYSFVNGVGMMIGMGASTRYSILKGEGRHDRTDSIFSQAMIAAVSFSLAISFLVIVFATPICEFLGADSEILPHARSYLRVLIFFTNAFVIKDILIFFIRNDSKPVLAMVALMAGSVTNIIFDYIFIMVLDMGMFGAALATGFAPVVSLAMMSIHFIKKENDFKFKWTKLSLHDIKDMAFLGMPGLIAELSYGISMLAFNYTLLKISGNTAVAAYSIIVNLSYLGMGLFMGAGEGIQPLVSINHGAKNTENIMTIYRKSFKLCVFLGAVFYAVSVLFTDELVRIFMKENDSELYRLTFEGMRIYYFSFLFAGVNMAISTLFSSVAAPFQSFMISMTRACFGVIIFVIILPKFFGVTGVWLTMPVSEIISFVMGLYYMHIYKKMLSRKGVLETEGHTGSEECVDKA